MRQPLTYAQAKEAIGMVLETGVNSKDEFTRLRKLLGYTVVSYADHMGLHRATVWRWEHSDQNIPGYAIQGLIITALHRILTSYVVGLDVMDTNKLMDMLQEKQHMDILPQDVFKLSTALHETLSVS